MTRIASPVPAARLVPPSVLARAALACLILITGAAAGEDSSTSHACSAIAEASGRLACYDKAFPPASDVPAESLEDQKARAQQDFGLDKQQLRSREPERMREIDPERIEATVTRLGQQSTGERVVTLDNDQVWVLTEVTSKGRLVVGDRIVVRRAALGSYMLLTPARIPLRAQRRR